MSPVEMHLARWCARRTEAEGTFVPGRVTFPCDDLSVSTSHPRPTLQQVALKAGVSRSTAGAALTGSGRVADSTAEKVRSAARSLGYRTEPHAALLRRGGPELATLVLDMRLTHTPDGSMHPFWARVLSGFVARMQIHNWLCIVQFQHAEAPLLPSPTPGVVLASSASGEVSLLVRDAFGQMVLGTDDSDDQDEARLSLHHDYAAVGRDCARYLHAAGCRRVLLLTRTGFAYAEMIMSHTAEALAAAGVEVVGPDLAGTPGARLARGMTTDIDGVFDLSASPVDLAVGLRERTIVRTDPGPGDLVVLTNADGLDPHDPSGFARLSFEGHATGCLAADFFIAAMEDRSAARTPLLPFAIHPPYSARP